jgi:hypothetical protein
LAAAAAAGLVDGSASTIVGELAAVSANQTGVVVAELASKEDRGSEGRARAHIISIGNREDVTGTNVALIGQIVDQVAVDFGSDREGVVDVVKVASTDGNNNTLHAESGIAGGVHAEPHGDVGCVVGSLGSTHIVGLRNACIGKNVSSLNGFTSAGLAADLGEADVVLAKGKSEKSEKYNNSLHFYCRN